MQTICEYLAYDHHRCDDLFLEVEACLGKRDWFGAKIAFGNFHESLLGHLDSEESIVFPVLETIVFNAGVPIAMLRLEHERMRGIVARLADALERHDPSDFVLHAETLTLLAQQHGVKEEEMLYPMLDRILSGNVLPVVEALRAAIDARGKTQASLQAATQANQVLVSCGGTCAGSGRLAAGSDAAGF